MKPKFTISIMLLAIGLVFRTYAQEVKLNTNFAVESDGTVRMDAGAMVWEDLRVTLDKGSNAASLGNFSGNSGPQIWYFRDNSTVESMSFTVQLPHNWKEGTTIYPHLHWTPKESLSGNVVWNFEYTWVNYNSTTAEVFPAISMRTVVSNGPYVANTHQLTVLTPNNAGLTATGKKISSILVCRIWRKSDNINDTYNASAGLLFIDFHYQIDTFGSREEYSK